MRRQYGAYSYLIESAEDAEEVAAWTWLLDRAQAQSASARPAPLKPREVPDRLRAVTACQLFYDETVDYDCPRPLTLATYDGKVLARSDISSYTFGWQHFRDALLTHSTRGRLLAFLGGARLAFHCILRHYGPQALADGWQIQPLASDTEIRALLFRRGKHKWTLTDAAIMTGLQDIGESALGISGTSQEPDTIIPLGSLLANIQSVQAHLASTYATSLGVSLASTSVKAASTFLPSDGWLWPPSALLDTMCRDGKAYRGGLVWARPFVGEAWQIDLNRAYTWSLSQPLPIRWAVGPYEEGDENGNGIYLCSVSGSSIAPTYLASWRGSSTGFRAGYWRGRSTLALLPSAEFRGLRAVGLSIVPRWGLRATSYTSISRFTAALWDVRKEHGNGSTYDRIGKLLGNAVYGKFGENPQRLDRIYSEAQPTSTAVQGLTPYGAEIADLWEDYKEVRRSHQHVDLAAWITSTVRGRLYEAIAKLDAAGIHTVAAFTDSLVCDADPSSVLDLDSDTLGGWRLVEHSTDVSICTDHAWRFGKRVKVAGSQVSEPGVIDELWRAGAVTIAQRRLQAPWVGDAMFIDTTRTLRRSPEEASMVAPQ